MEGNEFKNGDFKYCCKQKAQRTAEYLKFIH